jgi:hypothetical protein
MIYQGVILTEIDVVRTRIETRITLGHFMANMMRVASDDSPWLQNAFSEHLLKVSGFLIKFLENNHLIRTLTYRPQEFWPACADKAFGFIDGGVANIALPGVAPVGIRVGAYAVRPGSRDDDREEFKVEVSVIDDLYDSPGGLHDENVFEDVTKMRDAARIITETSGCLSLTTRRPDLDVVLMHGPLVNPAAPYGTPGFPRYRPDAAKKLAQVEGFAGDDDRHFVRLYRTILNSLAAGGCAVAGVVERDGGSQQVLKGYLDDMQEQEVISPSDRTEIENVLKRFGLSDTQVFDLVLAPGQYLAPLAMSRQGSSNKWPNDWSDTIANYPKALVTFLKPSGRSQPFRVEMFEDCAASDQVLDLVLHTSRLLPNYGFPAALDIVDKFAKIPNWMSANIATQHKVNLLRRAYASDDKAVRDFAKKMLTANGRDWLFRPKA